MSFFDCVAAAVADGHADKERGDRAQALWAELKDRYTAQGHPADVADAMAAEDVKRALKKEAGDKRHTYIAQLNVMRRLEADVNTAKDIGTLATNKIEHMAAGANPTTSLVGQANARLHTGVIAQRVIEAFAARGLDASDYGLLCYDEWPAEPEQVSEHVIEIAPAVYEQVLIRPPSHRMVEGDDGNMVEVEDMPAEYADGDLITPAVTETVRQVTPAVEAGSLYGIRYEEALCMEAAYQRRRADRMEARQVALDDRLAALEARIGGTDAT